jgi:hypothetical protein
MQPVPIPDRRIWDGARLVTIGAPRGMEDTVRPVEALIEQHPQLGRCAHLLVRVDQLDLERLAADPHFWLTIYGGGLPPFSLTVPELGP